MNKFMMGCVVVGTLAVPTFAGAAVNASGTLTVSGTVVSSISLTVESADGTFTLGGTDAAATDLGSISKYGTAPTGFTITPGGSSWTLSSVNGIGVMVVKANLASTAYTLSAKLGAPPAGSSAWTVGGVLMNSTTSQTIGSGVAYGSPASYGWSIVIPDSMSTATAIDNVIDFAAVSA